MSEPIRFADPDTRQAILRTIEERDKLRAENERLRGVINRAGALASQGASPEMIREALANHEQEPDDEKRS